MQQEAGDGSEMRYKRGVCVLVGGRAAVQATARPWTLRWEATGGAEQSRAAIWQLHKLTLVAARSAEWGEARARGRPVDSPSCMCEVMGPGPRRWR